MHLHSTKAPILKMVLEHKYKYLSFHSIRDLCPSDVVVVEWSQVRFHLPFILFMRNSSSEIVQELNKQIKIVLYVLPRQQNAKIYFEKGKKIISTLHQAHANCHLRSEAVSHPSVPGA